MAFVQYFLFYCLVIASEINTLHNIYFIINLWEEKYLSQFNSKVIDFIINCKMSTFEIRDKHVRHDQMKTFHKNLTE